MFALIPSVTVKAAAGAVPMAIPALWWMLREPGRWLILFFISALLLLPRRPLTSGNTGPHIAVAFAGFGLLIGMIHSVPIFMDRLSVSLCGLLTAMAASVAMAGIYSGLPVAAASMARVMLFGISV